MMYPNSFKNKLAAFLMAESLYAERGKAYIVLQDSEEYFVWPQEDIPIQTKKDTFAHNEFNIIIERKISSI